MKIIPFPKNWWTGGPYPERLSEPDDFEQEMEQTRQNQSLITMLEDRAKDRAAVSLAEIKQRLSRGCAAASSPN